MDFTSDLWSNPPRNPSFLSYAYTLLSSDCVLEAILGDNDSLLLLNPLVCSFLIRYALLMVIWLYLYLQLRIS